MNLKFLLFGIFSFFIVRGFTQPINSLYIKPGVAVGEEDGYFITSIGVESTPIRSVAFVPRIGATFITDDIDFFGGIDFATKLKFSPKPIYISFGLDFCSTFFTDLKSGSFTDVALSSSFFLSSGSLFEYIELGSYIGIWGSVFLGDVYPTVSFSLAFILNKKNKHDPFLFSLK